MPQNPRDFWQRFFSGIEVAVGGDLPDKLLGVREGFRRYFHEGLEQPVPVFVQPKPQDEGAPLPLNDEAILNLARSRAQALAEVWGERYGFYVGTETGMSTVRSGETTRYFVRSWTVVLGLGEESWGSSGAVQLPEQLIQGLDEAELPFAIPGRRRSGGMVSSLTGGLEQRRSTTALATFHAVATLMYGVLENRHQAWRRWD